MIDAAELLDFFRLRGLKLAAAESCTGGLLSARLTEIPGASDVVERGFVTYSNESKRDMLGVARSTLESFGAVSAETAKEMAEGALRHARVDVAVSITGIAGPGGGSAQKPVGLVHLGCAARGRATLLDERRFGDIGRNEIRELSCDAAMALLARQAQAFPGP